MGKFAHQERGTTRFEMQKAQANLLSLESKLEQMKQYLADLSESFSILRSKQIPIVSIREYRAITSIYPKLKQETLQLEIQVEAKKREVKLLKDEAKNAGQPKRPLATILEFRRRATRPKT